MRLRWRLQELSVLALCGGIHSEHMRTANRYRMVIEKIRQDRSQIEGEKAIAAAQTLPVPRSEGARVICGLLRRLRC